MTDQWLRVHVHPHAGHDALIQLGPGRFEAWVKAKPVEGGANAAVLRLLAGHLQLAQRHLRLMRGWNTRHKLFKLVG